MTDKLTTLLDDGTGRIRRELQPLHAGLSAVDSAQMENLLSWMAQPKINTLLTGLARGTIVISHEALAREPNLRTTSSLRELLMHHGVLPVMDKQLMLFQRWLTDRLERIDNIDHRRIVDRYATRHKLRRHRAASTQGPVSPSSTNQSRQSINRAVDFLTWLDEHHSTLATVSQTDVDQWFTDHYATRHPGQTFARWAMKTGYMPSRLLPTQATPPGTPLPQHRRLALITKLLIKTDTPLPERVAGLFVLLYAQPLSRIVTLTIDDIIDHGDQILVQFGEPTPAPGQLTELLRQLIRQRNAFRGPNFHTHWLFPGQRPGQPLVARYLGDKLHQHGIPVQAGRSATLQQLVLQAPAPVIATMLGFHHTHTARLVREHGGTWNRYAPGDHTK